MKLKDTSAATKSPLQLVNIFVSIYFAMGIYTEWFNESPLFEKLGEDTNRWKEHLPIEKDTVPKATHSYATQSCHNLKGPEYNDVIFNST